LPQNTVVYVDNNQPALSQARRTKRAAPCPLGTLQSTTTRTNCTLLGSAARTTHPALHQIACSLAALEDVVSAFEAGAEWLSH